MPRACLILLALLALLGRAPAQDPIGDVARQVLGSGGYQTDLPDAASDQPEADGTGSGSRRPVVAPSRAPLQVSRDLGYLLWIVLGVVAVAAVVSVVSSSMRRGRDVVLAGSRGDREPVDGPVAGFDPGAVPLDDAERLARDGRFGDAIRVLLLRTLDALRDRGGFAIAPWMTSREILRRAPLAARARAGLGELVAAVERSLFAHRAPDADDFESCANAYRALVEDARREPGA